MILSPEEEILAIVAIVKNFVRLLVEQRYDEIDQLTGGNPAPAAELGTYLRENHVTLTQPPAEAFSDIEFTDGETNICRKILNGHRGALIIDSHREFANVLFAMWTAEDGRSDYSLVLRVVKNADSTLTLIFEDLRVL